MDGVQYRFKRKSSECSAWRDEKGVKICKLFNIARETLYKWLWLEKNEWHLKPKTGYQKGHSNRTKDLDEFREFVSLHANYTQEEMARNYRVGSSAIGMALKNIWYSRKKRVKLIRKKAKKNELFMWLK